MAYLSAIGLLRLAVALAGAVPAAPVQRGAAADPATPQVRGAWLRFHELELCQAVDAVFTFRPGALDVWCVVEDEKSYDRLAELLEPLRAACTVTLLPTRTAAEKKGPEARDPPPSLWNNAQIRAQLMDPFGRQSASGGGIRSTSRGEGTINDPDAILKQRMLLFATQTLDWKTRMQRYAADLPELSSVAFEITGAPAELRARARTIAIAHARGVGRYAEKLADNVQHALPAPPRRPPARGRSFAGRANTVREQGSELASAARTVARRVERFIHPRIHTVGLVDLREPSLVQSLHTLAQMSAAYAHAAESQARR